MSREIVGLFGCGTVGISFLVTLVALTELVLGAENKNKEKDRIVLIIDIERPSFVDFGDSPVNETTELLSLIKYFNYL